MAIIEDYEAIAKRLRELRSTAPKTVTEIGDLERWRDMARQTARAYAESRRQGTGVGVVPRRLPYPTD